MFGRVSVSFGFSHAVRFNMPAQDRSIDGASASSGETTPQPADAPQSNPPQADSSFENGLLVFTRRSGA
jgi:hypothetical protein